MQSRMILALCLLGHLLDLSQAGPKEDARRLIEDNLPRFLEEGFRRAAEKLQNEERVARNAGNQQIARKLSRNRKTNARSKIASACDGSGILETTKVILEELDIDRNIVTEVLQSVTIDPSDLPSTVDNLPLCQSRSVTTRNCDPNYRYRLIDGSCNNLRDTSLGMPGLKFNRMLPAAYADNVSILRKAKSTKADLPNPRKVSYDLSQLQLANIKSGTITQMVKAWGQFLDHDITLTPESTAQGDPNGKPAHIPCCDDGTPTPSSETTEDCLQIDVSGDPFYTLHGVSCLRFLRSLSASATLALGPVQQINQVSSYIDASQVYGSDSEIEDELRDSQGGKLREHDASEISSCSVPSKCLHFLPESSSPTDENLFVAGDVRVNEQAGLTSMHTAFLRLHNIIASKFATLDGTLSHEFIYQETRRIVAALIQKITFAEFLPVVLGMTAMQDHFLELSTENNVFRGYDQSINSSIANVFATAAYRFGHALVGPLLVGGEDKPGRTEIPLEKLYFHNRLMIDDSTMSASALLEGECGLASMEMNANLVEALTNLLFATDSDKPHGTDLMALNIQRGRDHGLPGYNDWRALANLPKFTSFDQLKTGLSPAVVNVFRNLYTHVDDLDLFPAGLAENVVADGLLGPTFTYILAKQFSDLKFGDRFWFENPKQPKPFTREQLKIIGGTSLATVFCEVTTMESIQPKPMLLRNTNTNIPTSCSVFKESGVLKNLNEFLRRP